MKPDLARNSQRHAIPFFGTCLGTGLISFSARLFKERRRRNQVNNVVPQRFRLLPK
jgi:hypothetical protein